MKHIRIPGMRIISSALIILLLAVMAVSCGGGKTDNLRRNDDCRSRDRTGGEHNYC